MMQIRRTLWAMNAGSKTGLGSYSVLASLTGPEPPGYPPCPTHALFREFRVS